MLPLLLLPVLAPNLSRSLVVPHPDELGMPQQAISRPFHEGHFHNHLRLHPPQRRHVFGAVTNGDTPMVRLLLDAGANVDGSLGNGFTHLCWAAIYGRTAIVRLLLEAGASVSTRPSGYPLINFVTWGCHDERRLNEIVEVLAGATRNLPPPALGVDGHPVARVRAWRLHCGPVVAVSRRLRSSPGSERARPWIR